MSKSRRWSNASARSRPVTLDWRPSPQVSTLLAALALLAPFSLIASDLPFPWGIALAVPVLLAGVRTLRRYVRKRPTSFVVPLRGQVTRDGRPVAGFEVRWRGPLAFLRWRGADGGRRHLVFFPDTLDAGLRRELKLAMQQRQARPAAPAMAA